LFSGVVPYPSTIGDCTTDHFCIYLPGTEQATPPHRYSESSKSKLLGSELLLYSSEVALPLEFTVDPDTQKPGLLDRGNCLLVEVNWYCRGCVGTGEVDKFTLFWSKLYPLCSSPLAIDLPGALKVPVSRLCIPAEHEEVQVVSEADCNKACMITELGIETDSIEEEEDRREQCRNRIILQNPRAYNTRRSCYLPPRFPLGLRTVALRLTILSSSSEGSYRPEYNPPRPLPCLLLKPTSAHYAYCPIGSTCRLTHTSVLSGHIDSIIQA
jgi:hypothetical protein